MTADTVLNPVPPPPAVQDAAVAPAAVVLRGGSLSLLLLLALVALVCWPTALLLAGYWTDTASTTYVHGFLLLGVGAWLVWRRGLGRAPLALDLQPGAAVLLMVTGLCWAWSMQAGIGVLAILLMLCLLPLAALTFFGREGWRRTLFPGFLLLFAVPVWGAINPLLHWASVHVVQFLLLFAGFAVHLEGERVHLAAGSFEIADGCSGLHFLLASLAVAALLGELNDDTRRRRLTLLVLAGAMAVAMNWLRVLSIILIGQYTQMQHYIVRESHYGYGWALFALMLAAFLAVERRLPWQPPPAVQDAPAAAALLFPPFSAKGGARTSALVAAFLALLLPGLMRHLASRPVEPATALPVAPTGWQQVPLPERDAWQPRYDGADARQLARYERDAGQVVEVFAGAWGAMDPRAKFGGYFNGPMPGSALLEADSVLLNGWPAHRLLLRDSRGTQWVVLVGYDIAGRAFDSALQAQMWYGLSSLYHQHSVLARVLVLRSACRRDCRQAERLLSAFHTATGGSY